jgi:serine/threonine protein kinase
VRVGRYQVEERSRKEGGQAFVYFSSDGSDLALKVARPSDWSRRRMRREIAVQSDLDHPNILPIVDHDADRGWYATRRALSSLEDLGPFVRGEWTRLRVGLLAVVQAVAHAHSHGYVHRDLSPANILIFADRWVVADWGFVYEKPKAGPRMTQALERFGTPDFMAPELVFDPRKVTASVDVFSIGRIAAWGTGIEQGGSTGGYDPWVRWWRALIDGAAAYEPQLRWTMPDVIAHLRSGPALAGGVKARAIEYAGDEACGRCGSVAGRDHAERCLECHWLGD